MRMRSLAVSVGLVMLLSACGGSNNPVQAPTPTPPPAKAVIKVLIDPNPVMAVSSGNSNYPWAFRVNLQLSDSGGVAFIVTSMLTTVTSAISGQTLVSTDSNPFVGVKIPALGQETRQFYMPAYRMENYTKEGTINFKINFVDDKANASVYDGSVSVRHVHDPVHMP